MKKFIAILVLIAAAVGLYYVSKPNNEPTPLAEIPTQPTGAPTFTWSYTPVTDRDFPKTRVTLTATYPDSTKISKEIDTPDGSCNEYYQQDVDVYPRSTMIICYAAGLGHYYKVVEEGNIYLVQRKTFEEGSPEYNPPEQEFETIAQF